jgi:hypothetical protein
VGVRFFIASCFFGLTIFSRVEAAVFEVRLSSLEGSYLYPSARGPAPIDLHTALQGLAGISVRCSGFHTNGWWMGDGVEDHYNGPRGATLMIQMNLGGSNGDRWTFSTTFNATGPFSITNLLHRAGGGTNWDFLRDGITDLQASHEGVFGWGGFVTNPIVLITNLTVSIEASPAPLIISSLQLLPSGYVQFIVSGGAPGQTNIVEASSNLNLWSSVGTNVFPMTGYTQYPLILFQEPRGPALSGRFYRALNL